MRAVRGIVGDSATKTAEITDFRHIGCINRTFRYGRTDPAIHVCGLAESPVSLRSPRISAR
jgi:hypothetical protein